MSLRYHITTDAGPISMAWQAASRADERVKAIITSIGMRQQLCGVAYHNDLDCGVIFYEQGRPRNIVARY